MKSIFEGGVLGAIRGEWVLVVKCKDVDTCFVFFAILKKKGTVYVSIKPLIMYK